MSKRTRNFWIEAVVLVFLTVAGAAAFTVSSLLPLSKDNLRTQAGDLRSFAAAGRLLAIQFSRGEITDTFFRNQTELVQGKSSTAESSLRYAKTTPELRPQLDALTSLAREVSSALSEMHSGTDASSSAAKLDSLTHEFSALEDGLK